MATKSKAAKGKGVMIHIRISNEMHQLLQKATEQNGTSMQTEVVLRLERTFADEDEMMKEIKALNARLDKAETEGKQIDVRLEKAQAEHKQIEAEIAKAKAATAETAEMWTPLPKLGERYNDWVKRIRATKK